MVNRHLCAELITFSDSLFRSFIILLAKNKSKTFDHFRTFKQIDIITNQKLLTTFELLSGFKNEFDLQLDMKLNKSCHLLRKLIKIEIRFLFPKCLL
ncbi:hypothetical protein BpHYR1_051906 [Brachionus plicatilis]|uniref:Uncharacterized protein n=1 Tax=Brachionus plicatilis TaxID=10195 RepID=A0A3M7RM43_BRAPC|nr:hypothetical protein BpHYR1_051906 [Brachionus plicatilis]